MEAIFNKITLTVAEIKDLARFVGLRLEPNDLAFKGDDDIEITIEPCPEQGVKNDDDSIVHCRYVAYYSEYPEEGVGLLGDALPVETSTQTNPQP